MCRAIQARRRLGFCETERIPNADGRERLGLIGQFRVLLSCPTAFGFCETQRIPDSDSRGSVGLIVQFRVLLPCSTAFGFCETKRIPNPDIVSAWSDCVIRSSTAVTNGT